MMKQKFMHCFLCALLTLTCLTAVCATENDETSWSGKIENLAKKVFSESFINNVKGVCNHEKVQSIKEWMKENPLLGGLVVGVPSALLAIKSKWKLFRIVGVSGTILGTAMFVKNEYPESFKSFGEWLKKPSTNAIKK